MLVKSLVQWLIERQRAEGLSDVAFAARLGISQPTWNRIRNGYSGTSLRLTAKAIAAFPEDRETIVDLALPRDSVTEVA